MKNLELENIIAPIEGDGYDEDNPTEQTELLSLSVRGLLSHLSTEGLLIRQSESAEIDSVLSVHDLLAPMLTAGITYLDSSRAAYLAGESLPALPASFDPTNIVSLVTTLIPAIASGGLSLSALLPMLVPLAIKFVVLGSTNSFIDRSDGDLEGIRQELIAIREAITTNTTQITEGYNNMCDWIASLSETKQVGVMSTTEIDKVIWSERV
jgi:hypothetical protein